MQKQSIASNKSNQSDRFADHLISRESRTFARIIATATLIMMIVVGIALIYGAPAN
jgi:hypothetical protein